MPASALESSEPMLAENQVRSLLAPFELDLTAHQVGQLLTYLELLLRWNRSSNLTAVRTPEECVTRHFGESLYLTRQVALRGSNLDIGSGAGFPGLALKIALPNLATTLLEPVGKKRAFLKEVVRACQMESVEVRPERLEEFAERHLLPGVGTASLFHSATSRAVGGLDHLIPTALRVLKPGGHLCLWLGRQQSRALTEGIPGLAWRPAIPLPLSESREILVGVTGPGT
ncbi:MAG: 16S rRNA (guanine(527)-N(7))-methyltransferase RsmG [Acidobacteria bacterium]|nr:MAG: 16S rRNA (guanine(527)-N(7))-methyltransferase RsmG [Acidobacteriota bacterium]